MPKAQKPEKEYFKYKVIRIANLPSVDDILNILVNSRDIDMLTEAESIDKLYRKRLGVK